MSADYSDNNVNRLSVRITRSDCRENKQQTAVIKTSYFSTKPIPLTAVNVGPVDSLTFSLVSSTLICSPPCLSPFVHSKQLDPACTVSKLRCDLL